MAPISIKQSNPLEEEDLLMLKSVADPTLQKVIEREAAKYEQRQ